MTDEMAQDFSALATRHQEVYQTPLGDVLSQVGNAREFAQALTEGTNFSNNMLLEPLFTWRQSEGLS